MKIRPSGAELFHAHGQTDSQTDISNIRVAFLNFANAQKKFKNLRRGIYLGLRTVGK
jgi:hypothetical protein